RIDSRGGNVPRRLRGLRMDAGAVPSGAELWADTNGEERSAGVVTSVARHPAGGQVGLAYVKRGFAEMMEAEARWDGGAARVAVSPLPLDR
ncbi:MAG TPA: glycine cleavage T C-terminal barrel domain-containing protein, partial [Acidimicrobiales bacterium]|nr:glycine cleavage T C-terminal barrel domain-containing protein [Acidimicrobiales bacterium]